MTDLAQLLNAPIGTMPRILRTSGFRVLDSTLAIEGTAGGALFDGLHCNWLHIVTVERQVYFQSHYVLTFRDAAHSEEQVRHVKDLPGYRNNLLKTHLEFVDRMRAERAHTQADVRKICEQFGVEYSSLPSTQRFTNM